MEVVSAEKKTQWHVWMQTHSLSDMYLINMYLIELLVQNCVRNLMLDKRCFNCHQCLADAATAAEVMVRLG